MIIWLTGHSGSGKTTISREILKSGRFIHLDGDELRAVWPGLGLSIEDRREQNLRVARLAALMDSQGHDVVVSVIAPTQAIRDLVERICKPKWVYVKRDLPEREGHIYEVNESYQKLDNNGTIEDTMRQL